MGVLTLLSEAKSAGLQVSVDGDRLRITGARKAADIAGRLGDHKAEVIAYLTRAPIGQTVEDFIRENWPDATDEEPKTWRDLPNIIRTGRTAIWRSVRR